MDQAEAKAPLGPLAMQVVTCGVNGPDCLSSTVWDTAYIVGMVAGAWIGPAVVPYIDPPIGPAVVPYIEPQRPLSSF